jgi:HSP20 family protein
VSTIGVLVHRLVARGGHPERIPQLMRDVLGLVAEGGFFTSEGVNDRLRRLGWAEEILDQESFFLIVAVLESEMGIPGSPLSPGRRHSSLFVGRRCSPMLPSIRNPFGELDRMRREMDRLWDRFTGGILPSVSQRDLFPPLDLADRGDSLVVELEVPGMEAKDINLSVTGDVLTVSGEKKREREETEQDYHLVERSYGKFSRSVRLPATVDPERVEASYKDGVLRITMNKTEQAKAKRIDVKAG